MISERTALRTQQALPTPTGILGRTGVRVGRIGFGCCAIGGNHGSWGYGPADDGQSHAAIHRALELGCNFFDTADVYGFGHSEALLGQALSGVRDQVILATKVGYNFYRDPVTTDFSPGYLRFALDMCLKRLRTAYVDILQLHNPDPALVLDPDLAMTLEAFRSEGVVRWLGVSAATAEDAALMLGARWLDTIQVRYNALSQEAAELVFPRAMAMNVGVIAREPLANGYLTGGCGPERVFGRGDFRGLAHDATRKQLVLDVERLRSRLGPHETLAAYALRFALANPAVSVVIPGCRTSDQAAENLQALTGKRERQARSERSRSVYELKVRNAESPTSYRTFKLSEAEWVQWRDVLVKANVCRPEDFDVPSKRLVITYYPGTFPLPEEEDDDILALLR